MTTGIGLHYPRLGFHDEAWLKAALLYWPRMARIDLINIRYDCPAAFLIRDQLDFFVDVPLSGRSLDDLAAALTAVIDAREDQIVAQYALPARTARSSMLRGQVVHVDKMHYELWERLLGLGIADYGPGGHMQVHPHLANTYLCALAGIVAADNQLEPVSDDPSVYHALTGWDPDSLAAALLTDVPRQTPADNARPNRFGLLAALKPRPRRSDGEIAGAFATVAIESVLVHDLATIPVEKIIEARRELGPPLVAFRQFVRGLSDQLTPLASVSNPKVLQAHLTYLVATEIEPRITELERGMRALRLAPVRGVFAWKDVPVPALAVAAATAGHVPSPITIAVSGLAVAVTSIVRGRRDATAARRNSPLGYLLDLRGHLSPSR